MAKENLFILAVLGAAAGVVVGKERTTTKNSVNKNAFPLRPDVPIEDTETDWGYKKSFTVDNDKHIRLLITGANSYIGDSFHAYCELHYKNIDVHVLDMKNIRWRESDVWNENFDTVFHVAGIAHADVEHTTPEEQENYYRINTDLALETAKKAKESGVGQFIFMSSMMVYGTAERVDKYSIPHPDNFYGDSKWQADKGIRGLEDTDFHVAVLRTPMVYGRGSKGNYPVLAKLAKKLPVFPDVDNQRSMLYIDNLCEFLGKLMLSGEGGVYFPQNPEYTQTSGMVEVIGKVSGKRTTVTKLLNPAVALASHVPGKISRLVNKAFCNRVYDQELSHYDGLEYQYISFEKSVELTEGTLGIRSCANAAVAGEEQKPFVLLLTSVASMIDQFNKPNIKVLLALGFHVEVACNFKLGNTCTDEKIEELKEWLERLGVIWHQIDFIRSPVHLHEEIKPYGQVLKLCRKKHYSFIHCQSPIGGVIGRVVGHQTKTRVIYTAHGFHFYDGAPKKYWLTVYPLEKALSPWTDTLITITREDFKRASKDLRAKRTSYVPGIGIDMRKYGKSVSEEEQAAVRAELGIPADSVWLLSVGELNENKNHRVVIEALAGIEKKKDAHPILYTIAGKGAKQEELEQMILLSGLKEKVKLLGFRTDLEKLYASADIYILPSKREGLNVSLMEAMASGLPCIAGRIRGNVDLIDAEGGELFEPDSAGTCRSALEKMLSMTIEQRQEQGRYNRNKVKSFSEKIVTCKMKEIYSQYGDDNGQKA